MHQFNHPAIDLRRRQRIAFFAAEAPDTHNQITPPVDEPAALKLVELPIELSLRVSLYNYYVSLAAARPLQSS
ncbi:hypothetical protein ACRAWG_15910 [Methylobacterium sp. P31]